MSRSLEFVSLRSNEDGLVILECLCDCAAVTDVTLVDLAKALAKSPGLEFAFTCDGCGSSHWVTIAAATQTEAGGK